MDQPKASFSRFAARWMFTASGPVAIIFVCINLWFKPVFNLVGLLFLAGIFYNSWLAEKDKYAVKLFFFEPARAKKGMVFKVAFAIELMILLVGLHYLHKGFATVTGITEHWFNIETQNAFTGLLLSVGFITALAIITAMMLILYKISNSHVNRKLVMAYVLLDIFLLMPFNFMFSYENNQKENLTSFYSEAVPPLYDKLFSEITKKRADATFNYDLIEEKNKGIKADIDGIEEKKKLAEENLKVNTANVDDAEVKGNIIHRHNQDQKANNREIAQLKNKIDSSEYRLATIKNKYDSAIFILNRASIIVKGLNNDKIKKRDLFDSLIQVKQILLEVYNTDSAFLKDTVMSYQIEKLQVSKESPTDGFFALLHDLFSWALKKEQTQNGIANDKIIRTKGAEEWYSMLPRKRWFSFLFSISLDLIPLVIALSYIIYARQQSKSA